MIDPYKLRKDFPMIAEGVTMQGKPLIWLDNASTTFKPYCVLEAVERYYKRETSNSHRGDYDLCFQMDKEVEKARETIRAFINAEKSEEIVFTSGTTASMNLLAYGYASRYLTKDDEILLTEAEHASNVLPWYKVHEMTGAKVGFIPLTEDGRLTVENVEKSLTPNTKIVSIAEITNVLGYTAPIKEIAKLCHSRGILLAVDGAQSVPHKKTDVQDSDVDFLSFSGHKVCGPTGIGVLYGKFDLLSKMEPFMTGGGNNAKFDMCGDASYLAPPMRFEAGTQNLEGILGLRAAIEYVSKIGMDEIEAYEAELKRYAVEKIKATGNAIIYNEKSEGPIVTFNVDGVFAQDAATYFNSKGIAVRSGQHCAKILMDFLKTVATVRASFYFYTTKEEIDALADAVAHGKEFLDAYF